MYKGHISTMLEEGTCTGDCGVWVTECDELTLPEGTYTLSYAGGSPTIEVPGDAAGCH